MTTFRPTAAQKKFIEIAERSFDDRLSQPKSKSSYFLDKCSSEIGIAPAPDIDPRTNRKQRKIFGVIEELLGHNNCLVRFIRNH